MTAIAYFMFYGIPFGIAILCTKVHDEILNTLAWITAVFQEDFIVGMTFLCLASFLCVPLNIPYSINELFIAYCFIERFNMFCGVMLFLFVDPIMFVASSLLPFFLTRLLCENIVG